MLVVRQTLKFLSTLPLSRLALFSAIFYINSLCAQDCDLTIRATLLDKETRAPLEGALVYVNGHNTFFAISDSQGAFIIDNLCPKKYHLQISHVGCNEEVFYVSIESDTGITFYLNHKIHGLEGFKLKRKKRKTALESTTLVPNNYANSTNKDLGKLLENISGVGTLKNGNTLSKPIIHGMFGNRLAIVNQGVVHSGQQWGIDHAPEIDPLMAGKITLVKGVAAVEYQSSSLGSLVLLESNKISDEPHIHGEARTYFETNGRSKGVNMQVHQNLKGIKWRLMGTFKNGGDNKTPSYFLKNTGHQQNNTSFQLEKNFGKNFSSDLFISSFDSKMGILRGSHLGNLTDLTQAMHRDVPFYTDSFFSSELTAPSQKVHHVLLKFHFKWILGKRLVLDASFFRQQNHRKEFDVRRGGRSETPALSLRNYTNYWEIKSKSIIGDKWVFKNGIQATEIKNTNLPETGILPLIPDYFTNKFGFFSMVQYSSSETFVNMGGRVDWEDRRVATISRTYPRKLVRYDKEFFSASIHGGVSHMIQENIQIQYNVGLVFRNPEVNELYSFGLHQGVSGIEEGNPNLGHETSFKNSLSLQTEIAKKMGFKVLVYNQNIKNFIFLVPENEFRLSIRGAFPVFKYNQTDAHIYGADAEMNYQLTKSFNLDATYSYLVGTDQTTGNPLIYMPPNNLNLQANYRINKLSSFRNILLKTNLRYVGKQNRYNKGQDFLAPPNAYFLLGFGANTDLFKNNYKMTIFMEVENLLNTIYRDYLNRQRYFADGLGTNVQFGFRILF